MTGNTSVKAIFNQAIFTFQQQKLIRGHNQVEVTGFLAN